MLRTKVVNFSGKIQIWLKTFAKKTESRLGKVINPLNSSIGEFTTPVEGIYEFTISVVAEKRPYLEIVKNGQYAGYSCGNGDTATLFPGFHYIDDAFACTWLIPSFDVNDKIRIKVTHGVVHELGFNGKFIRPFY